VNAASQVVSAAGSAAGQAAKTAVSAVKKGGTQASAILDNGPKESKQLEILVRVRYFLQRGILN
jgi:hypothetical protein